MPKTQLPNGMSIQTYESPPARFDPLNASNRQLLKYGFPTRPNPKKEPELYKLWESAVSNNLTLVPPTFILRDTHKLIGENIEAGTSANWSGSVVSVPNAGNSFQWITGRWTVPNYIRPPQPWLPEQEAVSLWIGIDGTLRVGIEWGWLEPQRGGPLTATRPSWVYTVWWEWEYEDDIFRQELTTFPAVPGDVIWGALCVNSITSATILLSNVVQRIGTTFTVTAPTSAPPLVGNNAEWIVGRPHNYGVLPRLLDYTLVYFDEGRASYVTGHPGSKQNPTEVPLGNGKLLTMVGDNDAVLSVPTVESAHTMKVVWWKAS